MRNRWIKIVLALLVGGEEAHAQAATANQPQASVRFFLEVGELSTRSILPGRSSLTRASAAASSATSKSTTSSGP